jgi:hypothetical protein
MQRQEQDLLKGPCFWLLPILQTKKNTRQKTVWNGIAEGAKRTQSRYSSLKQVLLWRRMDEINENETDGWVDGQFKRKGSWTALHYINSKPFTYLHVI